MDFQLSMKVDTCLFTVKTLLNQKHGRITDLVVCKGGFNEQSELTDDTKMLQEYGIAGGPKEKAPTVTFYYNFKMVDCKEPDPILLSW